MAIRSLAPCTRPSSPRFRSIAAYTISLILPARSGHHVVEFPIAYAERVGVSKLARIRGTVWTFRRIAGAIGKGSRVRPHGRYDVRAT